MTPNPGDFFPGQGIFLGVAGPVGSAVEFHDPDDYLSTAPGENLSDGRGDLPGGYIESGLHKNFGPASTTDWSIEFLHRDDVLQPGDNNTEVIVQQARDGGEGLNTFGTAAIDFATGRPRAPLSSRMRKKDQRPETLCPSLQPFTEKDGLTRMRPRSRASGGTL